MHSFLSFGKKKSPVSSKNKYEVGRQINKQMPVQETNEKTQKGWRRQNGVRSFWRTKSKASTKLACNL